MLVFAVLLCFSDTCCFSILHAAMPVSYALQCSVFDLQFFDSHPHVLIQAPLVGAGLPTAIENRYIVVLRGGLSEAEGM